MTSGILSLDGGGACALFEVRALMALHDDTQTGHEVLQDFELFATNSGGSLELGGLLENLRLQDLLRYFENERNGWAVFSPTRSFSYGTLRNLTGIVAAPAQSRIARMNRLMSPVKDPAGNWIAPGGMSAAQFSYLVQLDMDAIEQSQVDAISKYADLCLQDKAPNQPILMDSDTLTVELGDGWFSRASASRNAIR